MKVIKRNFAGFSLVEMAVVIMLIGVLMTFGIKLATSFQDRSAFTATHNKQILIKEALISYLAQNGRLPCPASVSSPPTGIEEITASTCNVKPGFIPYVTLGIPLDTAVDGWGRLFLYEVTNPAIPACTSNWVKKSMFLGSTPTYHEDENGCINVVEDQNADGAVTADITRNNRVAVIISNGANGEGGYSSKGIATALSESDTTTSREKDNIREHSSKIAHTFHTEQITLTGFDDVILELSASDLLTPLKRDGSVVSINEVARRYFDTNISVPYSATPGLGCNISFTPPIALNVGDVAPATGSVSNQTSITFTANYNGKTYPYTLNSANYDCSLGLSY